MSATGYSPILIYGSTTTGNTPAAGNLTTGTSGVELAINATDGKLFYKDNAGVVQTIATKAGAAGTFSNVTITGGSINGTTIGATTASTGAFTTLSASSTVSGTGFSTYLASPPAIGSTAANTGAFTTLSASSTTTLSGGTANGVAYLNGSKVVTTGSALTYDGTTFTVTKATAYNARFAYDSPATYYTDIGYGGTNTVAPSAPFVYWSLNGSEQMRLTSTGLGIGTSSPTYKLDVQGSAGVGAQIYETSTGTNKRLRITQETAYAKYEATYSSGGNAHSWWNGGTRQMDLDVSGNLGLGVTPSAWASTHKALQMNWSAFSTDAGNGETSVSTNAFASAASTWNYRSTAPASRYTQDYYGKHIWFTAPSGTAGNAISFTQAMTLDASGRLGLGITNPSLSFEVGQNAAKGYMHSGVGVFSVGTSTNHPYTFDINGSERARITSGGNLLVGTTTAGASGTSVTVYDSTQSEIRLQNSTTGTGVSAGLQLAIAGTTAYLWNIANGPLVFAANNAERARIDSSGNLLVGTTSAEINSGVGIKLKNDSAKRLAIVSSESANAGGESLTMYSTGAGAFRFYVGWGGTVYATSTSISAISDQTLKENIRDLETGLTEVMALRPRRFDWKNGDAQDVAGFVAQEVEQVLPELVTDYVYNKDEDGNDIIKKSLKMGDILPTLVKAIQEQQAIITDLRARVAALEAA